MTLQPLTPVTIIPVHPLVPPVSERVAANQAAIDEILRVVYSQLHRLGLQLLPSTLPAPSMDQLRESPLGRDLQRLAALAHGDGTAPQAHVLSAVEAVLHLLFWPAAGEAFEVPRTFWTTAVGQLLGQAKFRTFQPSELIGIGDAARQLGVARMTIYRWIDEQVLDSVRGVTSGRTFVLRRELTRLPTPLPS